MPCMESGQKSCPKMSASWPLRICPSRLPRLRQKRKFAPPKRTTGAAKSAPKRTIGNLPAALPRIEEVIEPTSLICPCGYGIMHKIGEDRTERLDIVPAQLRVIVTVRPKYACRTCTDGVTQAPAPSHLITGGLPTEATIAHVLVSKYADHLPCIARARYWRVRASICTAQFWPTGSARPHSILSRRRPAG